MSDTQITEPADHLLRKRGYFYRPKAQGYTASVLEAGRYTMSEAVRRVAGCEGVSMHHVSDYPELLAPAPTGDVMRGVGELPDQLRAIALHDGHSSDWWVNSCATIHKAAEELERLEFEGQRADLARHRLGAKWKEATAELDRANSRLAAQTNGLKAAIRAAKLALFVINKQGVMPNSSWESGFKADMAAARAALTGAGEEGE